VVIGQDPNLKIEGIQIQTDNYGKAIFDIAASKTGDYFLEVKVDGQILPKKPIYHLTNFQFSSKNFHSIFNNSIFKCLIID
jgi:hypothetical protein